MLDGFAYGLDEGTLSCIEIETGKRRWKDGRYGYGQVLLAGSHLVVMDEDGAVHLVEASPDEHRELSSFTALDGGTTLNLPALAHGRLYVRSERELACFDLRPRNTAQ